MTRAYHEIREEISTGQLVFFEALGPWAWLSAPWGRKLATLGGTISNRAIMAGQFFACPAQWRDGLWRFVHVGMVCRGAGMQQVGAGLASYDEVLLFESMNPGGPRLSRLSERIRDYPGRVLLVPLSRSDDKARARLAERIREARHDAYRYDMFGLLGVLGGFGIDSPDAMFCSELVVDLLQQVGAMPGKTRIFRKGKLRSSQLRASAYPPCRLARDSVADLGNAQLVVVRHQTSDVRAQKAGSPACSGAGREQQQ